MPEGAWPILTYAPNGTWDLPRIRQPAGVPRAIPQRLADRLCRLAETAWRTMQARATAVSTCAWTTRAAVVLEVNPNPDLTDGRPVADGEAAGWDYAELIRRIAEMRCGRPRNEGARELLAAPRRARAPRTA